MEVLRTVWDKRGTCMSHHRTAPVSAQLAFLCMVSVVCTMPRATSANDNILERAKTNPVIPAVLTLNDALKLLRKRGLDTLIAEVNVNAAKGAVTAAGAIQNPLVNGAYIHSFDYQPTEDSCADHGCRKNGWQAGINDQGALTDLLFGKRAKRIEVYEAAHKAAKLGRKDAIRQLEFQVKTQYVRVAFAEEFLDFTREVKDVYEQVFKLTAIRYAAGAISEADLAKAETAKLEAEQNLTSAEQGLIIVKAGLAYLLGVRGIAPHFEISNDALRFRSTGLPMNKPVGELINDAIKNRPDLQQNLAQKESALANIDSTKRQVIPPVALTAQFMDQGRGAYALQPPTLTVGVTVPLPVFYQYQGDIEKAKAVYQVQVLEDLKLRSQIAAEVQAAHAEMMASRKRLERMENQLLATSKRARDLVRIQYEKGAASLLEFLDAQRTFINTNLEYLQDSVDFWTSVYRLEQTVGLELRS